MERMFAEIRMVSLDTYQVLSVIILSVEDWTLSSLVQLFSDKFGTQNGPTYVKIGLIQAS